MAFFVILIDSPDPSDAPSLRPGGSVRCFHLNAAARGRAASATLTVLEVDLAEKNPATLYQAEYLGNGTFIIRKPKRNARKLRQLRLKSPNPGMRK